MRIERELLSLASSFVWLNKSKNLRRSMTLFCARTGPVEITGLLWSHKQSRIMQSKPTESGAMLIVLQTLIASAVRNSSLPLTSRYQSAIFLKWLAESYVSYLKIEVSVYDLLKVISIIHNSKVVMIRRRRKRGSFLKVLHLLCPAYLFVLLSTCKKDS